MVFKILIALCSIGLILGAVRSRIKLKRRRAFETMETVVASPVSIAIGELIAIAGGIYLSLMLLVSFLKITLPDTVSILNLQLDPLAMIAIAITLLQPIFLSLYSYSSKR